MSSELPRDPWETNLFSEYYLTERFPKTDTVTTTPKSELQHTFKQIKELYTDENTVTTDSEAELEETFIKPVLSILGHSFEVQKTVQDSSRRPDYAFFPSDAAAEAAFERDQRGGDFYEDAVAVGDAKRWGRKLDYQYERRSFDNPAYQLHCYLEQTECNWGILTNGRFWRLYYLHESYRLDTYYEVDLEAIIETDDIEAFKYFYFFFRQAAFVPDDSGNTFVDYVFDQSASIADELSDDLQDRVYEALRVLATGFVSHPDNDLGVDDLPEVKDGAFLLVYRLMFILYAEHSERALLPDNSPAFQQYYSLDSLKHEVVDELDRPEPGYTETHDRYWSRLTELFRVLAGEETGAPVSAESMPSLPVYGKQLFGAETSAGEFLDEYTIGDWYLARTLVLITQAETEDQRGEVFVDYNGLDIQHLGAIYERLLEYNLRIADQPRAQRDHGEYVEITEGDPDGADIEPGEVYFEREMEDREATGSFFTPDAVTEEIVQSTIDPVVDEIHAELEEQELETTYARAFTERVLDVDIIDPAMGSGHFLVGAIEYLAEQILDVLRRQAQRGDRGFVPHDIQWARRQVAQNCIYGIDKNPFAVMLAKVSVWLRTATEESPLLYLDDQLKCGNSLVGWGAPPAVSPTEHDTPLESPGLDELDTAYTSRDSHPEAGETVLQEDGGVSGLQSFVQATLNRPDSPAESVADVREAIAAQSVVQDHGFKQAVQLLADTQTAASFSESIDDSHIQTVWDVIEGNRSVDSVRDTEWFETVQSLRDEHRFFHWWLEFPRVFEAALDQSESDLSQQASETEAGFDIVMGNPPHMGSKARKEHLPDESEYYRAEYDTPTGSYNLYVPFLERCYSVIRDRGFVGVIQPHKFFHTDFGEGLREFFAERNSLYKIVSFGHEQVWEDVSVYACLLFLQRGENGWFPYTETTPEALEDDDINFRSIPCDAYDADSWVFYADEDYEVIETLHDGARELGDIADVYVGVQTSLDDVFVVEEVNNDRLTSTLVRGIDGEVWDFDSRLIRPYLGGNDVDKYSALDPDKHVIFPYHIQETESGREATFITEEEMESRFPEVYEYLSTHKEKLLDRSRVDEENGRWYDFGRPQNLTRFDQPKLLTPSISYGTNLTYDENTAHKTKVYGVDTQSDAVSEWYLLGVLNTNLTWYFLVQTGYTFRGGYRTFKTDYLEPVPIHIPDQTTPPDKHSQILDIAKRRFDEYMDLAVPASSPPPVLFDDIDTVDDVAAAFIEDLAQDLMTLQRKHDEFALDFEDHVTDEIIEWGEPLEAWADDVGEELVPPAILTSTRDEYKYRKLRIGEVSVSYDADAEQCTVSMTARYKPDTPEKYDTSPYGYVEKGPFDAITISDVSADEAVLLEEFIPRAASRAKGYANYRKKATKSHTLIDRLLAMEVPTLDSVGDHLTEFRAEQAAAARINTQFQKVSRVMRELVYRLYGLSPEQAALVEACDPELPDKD